MKRLKDNYLLVSQKYEQFRSARGQVWCLTPSVAKDAAKAFCEDAMAREIAQFDADGPRSQQSESNERSQRSSARASDAGPRSAGRRQQQPSFCRSELSGSSSSSSQQLYEGGSRHSSGGGDDNDYDEPNAANSVIQEEDEDGALDPDDPYQINRLNEIPHEHLKELYTQVVDELLDIQLEFEEKLAEVEEQAHLDVQEVTRQKEEAEETGKRQAEALQEDLEKHKAAIAKLSEKVKKNQEQLAKARQQAQGGASGAAGGQSASPAELQRLQDKIDQLQEDYNEEKREAVKLEEKFDQYKAKMEKQEDTYKEQQRQLAKVEIENDELKNDIRQMGFMVEDLEQKLDSQLEINELLTTEQEEMKQHLEEQNERLRQQLEEQAVELIVKEKELKKIKFNQLLIDTQATFMQEAAIKGVNSGARHSNTVHEPARNSEPLGAGGKEGAPDATGEQEKAARGSQEKPDANASAGNAAGALEEAGASSGNVNPDGADQRQPGSISKDGSEVKPAEAAAPLAPAGASSAKAVDAEILSEKPSPAAAPPNQEDSRLPSTNERSPNDRVVAEGRGDGAEVSPDPFAAEPAAAVEESLRDKVGHPDQKSSERGPVHLQDVVVEDVGDDEGGSNTKARAPAKGGSGDHLNGEQAYASFAGNAAIGAGSNDLASAEKLLGLADLDPAEFLKNLQLDGQHDEAASAALGLGDIQIDELLDCGDDLMDIEQTAFIGSSKVMLKMLDNMIQTIDARVETVKMHPTLYNASQPEAELVDLKRAA